MNLKKMELVAQKTTVVATILKSLRDDPNITDVSKAMMGTLLKTRQLELDDPDVQNILQGMHARRFIELRREDGVYLQILKRGVEYDMTSVLVIMNQIKNDVGTITFRKPEIVSYLKKIGLEITDEKVQAVLQKWHDEGYIELIQDENVYLKLLN